MMSVELRNQAKNVLELRTIHISPETMKKIERLVKAGLFPSKGEAIRTILEASLPVYMKLLKEDFEENPVTIVSDKQWEGKDMPMVSVKLPPAILELLKEEEKKTGYSRSQLIRLAITKMLLTERVRT
jgi:Arc/MetJ-type ribon-helix-helix transcriptional regulator